MTSPVNVDVKLGVNKFNVDEEHPHIVVKADADKQALELLVDAPRDKCTLSCAINGIHAAFHYLKKNYISGCVMTVPTG